jgi:hypothetical protein
MSLTMQQKADIATEAAKASPPVAVAGATIAGVSVNDLVLWVTLIYLVLQIGFLLYRWGRMHFRGGSDAE